MSPPTMFNPRHPLRISIPCIDVRPPISGVPTKYEHELVFFFCSDLVYYSHRLDFFGFHGMSNKRTVQKNIHKQ